MIEKRFESMYRLVLQHMQYNLSKCPVPASLLNLVFLPKSDLEWVGVYIEKRQIRKNTRAIHKQYKQQHFDVPL